MGGVEREVKLGAWPGLVLPDLTDVIPGASVVALRPLRLRATYYDTSDLRLARSGISLRYRTETTVAAPEQASSGAGPGGRADGGAGGRTGARTGGWTVKFPEGDAGPGLARREIDLRGGEGRIPPSVVHLVRAHVRSAALVAVARLRTDRRRVELRDSDGKRLVEIDDDEVSVLVAGQDGRGRRVAARFREIEAELTDGESFDALESVVARLREAGAGAPDPTPKVVRALGPSALAPADVVAAKVGARSTAGHAVQAAVAASVARLLAHDPGVRIGEDPEDVHQARVATRRLRSDLRTFRPLLDASWVAGLRDELGWIAGLLGAVRDTDVLLEHLQADVRRLDISDAAAGAAVLRRLETQRRAARATLLAALDSDRYVALLEALVEAAQRPRLATPAPAPAPAPAAPASESPAVDPATDSPSRVPIPTTPAPSPAYLVSPAASPAPPVAPPTGAAVDPTDGPASERSVFRTPPVEGGVLHSPAAADDTPAVQRANALPSATAAPHEATAITATAEASVAVAPAADAPPIADTDGPTDGAGPPDRPPSADQLAKDVLPALVRRPWRHLRRAVEAIDSDPPPDETLHEIRILSKRCRYAAEAAVPAIGKPAAKFGSAVAEVQGVLGDLHDAVVAEAWLRDAAVRAPAAQVLVVGELIALQRRKAAACRAAWQDEWRKASSKHLRAWLAGL